MPEPECGGKLRVVVCIEDPALIREILEYVRCREALPTSAADWNDCATDGTFGVHGLLMAIKRISGTWLLC